ncbi:MAG TPA: hypothetical protein VIW95_10200 [Candidatus Binatus sp.]|jgi:hypothetical protein|uniref:hypothetical protein n=1 Tax=Candidatus Binatus sp. TaxID=2811406 RepID=UPI002F3F0C42
MSSKDPIVRDAVEMRLVFALLLLMAVLIIQGCTAFNPQGAAIQQTPNYYNGESYSQLSPEQKMQLEDHLANQSNSAWRTSADVASGAGQLEQGTGFLLRGIDGIEHH